MKAKLSLIKHEAEIEASEKEATDFLNGIIPEFVKEAGGILTDTIGYWRWSNKINLIKKSIDKVEQSGLSKQQIPLKVLLPIIESSSLEEDASMQEKWSNLLANAATGKREIKPHYIEILKELSPLEANILDNLYDVANKETDYNKRKQMQYSKEKMVEIYKFSSEDADVLIENLYRLNLCQPPASHGGVSLGDYPIMMRTNDFFEFTTLGFNFVKACKWE